MCFLIILRKVSTSYACKVYCVVVDTNAHDPVFVWESFCMSIYLLLCFCRQKGSDASWLNDEEPTAQVQQFLCVLKNCWTNHV